ncbi:YybH family protein [Micromonospora sp. LZ34]
MPEPATSPDDLGRFFVARANARDVEGLVALYEPDGVFATPAGPAAGADQIRVAFEQMLADGPTFTPGQPQPTLYAGELALTSTRLDDGSLTAEVARRQPDGTWRWVLDQPRFVPPPAG